MNDEIIDETVFKKFNQNKSLRKELRATGQKILAEYTRRDSYWTEGGDGSGKNNWENSQ
jgi:predicted NAD-dependent protein-ADP-ribosyltransferase YbiA (DUF1768 family)